MKNNPAYPSVQLACRAVVCLVLLATFAAVFGVLSVPGPAFAQAETGTPAPEPSITPTPLESATPTRTPIPAAYLQTDFQTNGLIIGASVLVIVIVGGTLFAIRRSDHVQ